MKNIRFRFIYVAALTGGSMLLSSCMTARPIDVENAVLYYPPEFKYVDTLRYSFSSAERIKALRSMAKADADTLFEVIIDREGNARRARLLRTNVRGYYHADMEKHAMIMKFTPDPDGKMPYRAFYLPAKYRYKSTFEWM